MLAEPVQRIRRRARDLPVLEQLGMRDVLGLGEEARMNRPGTYGAPNWGWRLQPGQLTPGAADRLRAATVASARAPSRRSRLPERVALVA